MNDLAELYRVEGEYTRAGALYVEALKAGRRGLGEEHPRGSCSPPNVVARKRRLYVAPQAFLDS